MRNYIIRRCLQAMVGLLVTSIVVFLLVRVAGDPVKFFVAPESTPEEIEAIRERLGFADPLPTQYFRFIGGLLRGDLGFSFRYTERVSTLIAARLPATLTLLVSSMVFAIVVSFPLGVTAAAYRGKWVDQLIGVTSVIGQSMPMFWTGLLLILYVAVPTRWLPTGGLDHPRAIVLPSITLGTYLLARLVRLVRSSMLDCLAEDYVQTARAKGLSPRVVLYKHVLRNAAIPAVTVIGLQIGGLLGGAVVVENIFSWAGMGTLFVSSVYARDYAVVQACVLMFAVVFATVNLLLDITYAWIDPRIRYS